MKVKMQIEESRLLAALSLILVKSNLTGSPLNRYGFVSLDDLTTNLSKVLDMRIHNRWFARYNAATLAKFGLVPHRKSVRGYIGYYLNPELNIGEK